MTTKDTALRLALEALEPVSTYGRAGSRDTDTAKAQQAITAIREALAQPAGERGGLLKLVQAVRRTGIDNPDTQDALDDLEAALLSSDAQPSEWVGLSLEEIWDSAHGLTRIQKDDWVATDADLIEFAHIVEARLREKNAGKPAAEDEAGGEPVAYRHLHEGEWEYYDAPTGEDCSGCQALFTRPQPQGGE